MKKKFFSLNRHKAIKVEGDNLIPFAYNGQFILFSKNAPIKNGDRIYVRLTKKEATVMPYCEDKVKKVRYLIPVGLNDKTPLINLCKRTPLFMYRVTEIITQYN